MTLFHAHEHHRSRVPGLVDPNARGLEIVEFAPHNMVSDNSPTPFVTSASSSYSGDFAPFKAFNGLVGTNSYWLPSGSTGWLQLDVGSAKAYMLTSYSVQVNTIPEPNRAPKDWTMQGRNDGATWDVLDTVSGQTGWNSGETRTFGCDVQTSYYRYFRINITANNGDGLAQVGELYLYGVAL